MQSTPSVLKDCCSPALTGYPFGGLEIVTCRTSVKFALISRPDQQRVLRSQEGNSCPEQEALSRKPRGSLLLRGATPSWARGECCVRLQ